MFITPGSGPEPAQNPRYPKEHGRADPPSDPSRGTVTKTKMKNVLKHNLVMSLLSRDAQLSSRTR